MTERDVRALLTDVDTVALTLWAEARGEPIEGKIAVACVIRNRMHDPRWPNSLKAVCLQPAQFSCWNPDGSVNHRALLTMAEAILASTATNPILLECQWIAQGIATGVIRDRSKAANHYLTAALFESHPPMWAREKHPVDVIGAHVFLRL